MTSENAVANAFLEEPASSISITIRAALVATVIPLLLAAGTCLEAHARELSAREAATLSSWAATAEMVLDQRLAGSVPRAYAERTLASAARELARQGADNAELARLQALIEMARQRLKAGQDGALAASLDDIRAANGRLRAAMQAKP